MLDYVSFGVPKTFFVGLKEVESAKAPDILEAIKSVMDEKDRQWKQKLISTGTDGASVMLGRLGGVVALIPTRSTSSNWDPLCSLQLGTGICRHTEIKFNNERNQRVVKWLLETLPVLTKGSKRTSRTGRSNGGKSG